MGSLNEAEASCKSLQRSIVLWEAMSESTSTLSPSIILLFTAHLGVASLPCKSLKSRASPRIGLWDCGRRSKERGSSKERSKEVDQIAQSRAQEFNPGVVHPFLGAPAIASQFGTYLTLRVAVLKREGKVWMELELFDYPKV